MTMVGLGEMHGSRGCQSLTTDSAQLRAQARLHDRRLGVGMPLVLCHPPSGTPPGALARACILGELRVLVLHHHEKVNDASHPNIARLSAES